MLQLLAHRSNHSAVELTTRLNPEATVEVCIILCLINISFSNRQALEQEKMKLLESGAAGAILQHALARESDWHQRASAMLKDLEEDLVERQGAYCNLLLPREHRLEMEKNLLLKVVKEPLGTDTDLEGDLKDIFKNDRYCAKGNNRLLNVKKMDKRKNGSLMWLYLRYWQLQVTMEAHKRAEDSILGVTPDNNLK